MRLRCIIQETANVTLPRADDHPLWLAMDNLSEKVHESLQARGGCESREQGSLLTVSGDTPRSVHYCWVELPASPAARAPLLDVILEQLAAARRSLPDADWEVTLEDEPLAWRDGRFHL